MFDKEALRQQILRELVDQANLIQRALEAAKEATIHPDARQEGKYDTRAIESGYLASAQAERLLRLRANIASLAALKLESFSQTEAVGNTALVTLDTSGAVRRFFLLPYAVGARAATDLGEVWIIAPDSRIGIELIGLNVGDEIESPVISGTVQAIE